MPSRGGLGTTATRGRERMVCAPSPLRAFLFAHTAIAIPAVLLTTLFRTVVIGSFSATFPIYEAAALTATTKNPRANFPHLARTVRIRK